MGIAIKGAVRMAGIGGSLLLSLSLGGQTLADSTATATASVTGGSLSASLSNLTLPSKSYSFSDQTTSATGTLTVADTRGTISDWNGTILSSNFTGTGGSIDASNYSLTNAGTPVKTSGQGRDSVGVGGPNAGATATGTLNTARKVITANPHFGNGVYTQNLDTSLTIPAQTAPGTCTATITATASNGPSRDCAQYESSPVSSAPGFGRALMLREPSSLWLVSLPRSLVDGICDRKKPANAVRTRVSSHASIWMALRAPLRGVADISRRSVLRVRDWSHR